MSGQLFDEAFEEWVAHCAKPKVLLSSSGNSVTDCEPYRKILSMGRAALPLIRLAYDRREPGNLALAIVQGHGLVWLVQEIAGSDFSVPESIQGMICAVEDYTKRWLDENLGRYAGAQ